MLTVTVTNGRKAQYKMCIKVYFEEETKILKLDVSTKLNEIFDLQSRP